LKKLDFFDINLTNPMISNMFDPEMKFTFSTVALEVAVLLVIYRVVFFVWLKRALTELYSRQKFWDYLKTYNGLVTKDVQVEIVYMSILGAHHITGGLFMLYGYVYDNPTAFAHGALFEVVDGIHDTISMVSLSWPFVTVDPQFMSIMIIHHLFSILMAPPVIVYGYHSDPNLQMIGVCLLLAGGFTASFVALSRTMDRRVARERWEDAGVWTVNGILFFFLRFYVFPRELNTYFHKDAFAEMGLKLQILTFIGVALMTVFNFMFASDVAKTAFNRVKLAIVTKKTA